MSESSVLLTPIGILASNPKRLTTIMPNRQNPADEGSFYVRICFTAADLESAPWKALMNALVAKGVEKFGKGFPAMLKEGGVKQPVRKDLVTNGYDPEQFAAFLNLNAYADNPPALIGRDGTPLSAHALLQLGCRVRASVYATAYEHSGNRGVNLKLRGVQYAGPVVPGLTLPVKGAGDPSKDFGALDPDDAPSAAAGEDYSSLLA